MRPVDTLPPDITALAIAARRERHRLVSRLIAGFANGTNRFDRPGEGLWTARAGTELVGICGLNVDPFADPGEQAGRVRHLYVAAGHRRRGIGSLLLGRVEEKARLHFEILTAFTIAEAATGLYLSRGYRPVTGVERRSVVLELANAPR